MLNLSSLGWNPPLATTPLWIVNVLPVKPVPSVQATGKAPGLLPKPPGGWLSSTLTTGALLSALRQLAAVTVTLYVPTPAYVIESPEPTFMAPFGSTAAHACPRGRSSAELSPMRL
jgi:hypothetical protein